MRYLLLATAATGLCACIDIPEPPATFEAGDAPSFSEIDAFDLSDVETFETRTALFGDLHIHTTNSFDAYIFGTRSTPDDAYAFARGETIDNGAGVPITLSGPALDFIAVTDHGEYMGIVPEMARRGSELNKTETAQSIFGLTATDRRANFIQIGRTIVTGEELPDIYDREHMDSVWAATVAAANRAYAPGQLTTFAGYEFTAMEPVGSALDTQAGAKNLHRNVIFRGQAPDQLFTTLDSPNPEDLWDWMDRERAAGREVLSIPHNSNASNGRMFAGVTTDGSPLTVAYAQQRRRNEPIAEITQVKGTSETHPNIAPNDEWADFELYSNLIGAVSQSEPVRGSFVRSALADSLSLPGDPYHVGFIGSSDTHVSAGAFSEEDFFGKFPPDVTNENRQSVPEDPAAGWPEDVADVPDLIAAPQYGASGLAGVWARSNTRGDIFDAMAARETFGTSGPRIRPRLFMGGYSEMDLISPDRLERAYAGGVPMGSTVEAPGRLIATAAADPSSEPLERLQIIALRADGSEEIYDVACADGAPIDAATHRCQLPEGAVELSTCAASGAGAGELSAIWDDPNASETEPAAYYLRVLERPKCRWSTWDAVRAGTLPKPGRTAVIQDRAWSSPIWVKPG